MTRGAYKMIYVAPERLRHRGFTNRLGQTDVALLAVDEAHCVSQWGHDFRPDYLNIARAHKSFRNKVPTVALTATATPNVQTDICGVLELKNPKRLVTGFNRPNLFFSVESTPSADDKRRTLKAFIDEREGDPGLVYVSTRKQAESVTEYLREQLGLDARAYHAGLPDRERNAVQDAFIERRLDLVVATNAFGMGVDRADVRWVVHWTLPATLEAYYQEAGRAGRDGLPSEALLLYAPSDRQLRDWLIEQNAPTEESIKTLFRHLHRVTNAEGEAEAEPDHLAEKLDLHPVGTRVALGLLERMGALHRMADFGPVRRWEVVGWHDGKAAPILDSVTKRREYKGRALNGMANYAEGEACRRQALLDHFGRPRACRGGPVLRRLRHPGAARRRRSARHDPAV